jgi:hypothetical protein
LVLPDSNKQLFNLPPIQRYITRGKTNVVICEFDYDESQSLLTSVAAPPQSQLSQYSIEASNMGGYPFADPFNLRFGMPPNLTMPMGYGFAAPGNELDMGDGNGPLDGMGPLGPEM